MRKSCFDKNTFVKMDTAFTKCGLLPFSTAISFRYCSFHGIILCKKSGSLHDYSMNTAISNRRRKRQRGIQQTAQYYALQLAVPEGETRLDEADGDTLRGSYVCLRF